MKTEKVEITITEGHNYDKSVKSGAPYTSVEFEATRYGSGSPCDNEKEIQSAIKHAKEWIREKGDIPVIVDKRAKAQLTNWF